MAVKKTQGKKTTSKKTTKKKMSQAELEALETKRAYYGLGFIAIAVLVTFTIFNPSEAFLLETVKNMITFLIGYGLWFLPFSLGIIGVYCFMPFKGNASLRCGAFLMFSLISSSFIHLVEHGSRYLITDLSVVISKAVEMESAGLIGGLLAIVLEAALTEVGAMLVLVIAGIACLLIGFDVTPVELMAKMKEYFEKLAYEEDEEEVQYKATEKEKKKEFKKAKKDKQKEHTDRLKQARAIELQKTYEEARRYAEVKTPKRLEKYAIDLPLEFSKPQAPKVAEAETKATVEESPRMDAWVLDEYERLKKQDEKKRRENQALRQSLNEGFGFSDDMLSREMEEMYGTNNEVSVNPDLFFGNNPKPPKPMNINPTMPGTQFGANGQYIPTHEVEKPKYTIHDHKMQYQEKGNANIYGQNNQMQNGYIPNQQVTNMNMPNNQSNVVNTQEDGRNYVYPEMQMPQNNMFANQHVQYTEKNVNSQYGQGYVIPPYNYQNGQNPNQGQNQYNPNGVVNGVPQNNVRNQEIANQVARDAQLMYRQEQAKMEEISKDPYAQTLYFNRIKQQVECDYTRSTMRFKADASQDPSNVLNPMQLYSYPPITLLQEPLHDKKIDPTDELRDSSERLIETLGSFGIKSEIVHIVRGPSVTRFEITIAKGVKYSKLAGLSDDIGLALGSASVRIATIPEKGAIGIEVPNKNTDIVTIREVLDTPEFVNTTSKLSYTLGKDITGHPVIGDIAKMPHMLIAGTTGSGKSVCVNSMLVSLLYKANPEEVKFIMIDPKMVELGGYNGIPHLLIPVVTDPKKAAGALSWAVGEMERRYGLMEANRVKDIDMFNKAVEKKRLEGNMEIEKLPRIVIVIDELADLMMVAAKDVEESICRIAQKARAAGMHLVIATQRPSADVITGIMKANVPSRVSFAVSSQIESRIILDVTGAEKLIGKGDMLYNPLGASKPNRLQGCFITGTEVDEVVDYVKSMADPDYNEEVMTHIESHTMKGEKDSGGSSGGGGGDDEDELIIDAIDAIVQSGQASSSFLQRKLRLGYSRAARIIDQIEDRGIIGSGNGSKSREILITKYDWQEMRARMSES